MELGCHELDQTAEFIWEGASMTTWPIALIKGMFLYTDHEVDQENADILQDHQWALDVSLILWNIQSRLKGQLELLQ